MSFRRRTTESPKVDLTPMIDVVFLLLIFFMISTTFIERPGLNIDLPQGGAEKIAQGKNEVQVYLAADGTVFLEREETDMDSLQLYLRGFGLPRAKQMTFLLMADKNARHGQVIELMDSAKLAGFGKLAIATEKKPGQEEE